MTITNKDLRSMMKNIESSEAIDNIFEIAKKMAGIIINDKRISIDTKMRYLFLYYQL